MERGVNLYLPDGKLKIDDNIFERTATGINVDSDATNDDFGDLHCHPSNSIGHVNGYAAHSPCTCLLVYNLPLCWNSRQIDSGGGHAVI